MNIISLEILDYKKIRAISLAFKPGEPLKVVGPTGQGKTTAISALWDLLEKASDPIRHGAKKATIRIKLGDASGAPAVIAERTYTNSTSTITIKGADGEKIGAREFGDWFSALAVNPHRIMAMKPLERVAALLEAATLPDGFDLAAIDAEKEAASVARLVASRLLDVAKDPGIQPEAVEPVDTTATLAQISAAQELNNNRAAAMQDANSMMEEIITLQARITDLTARGKKVDEWLSANPFVDVEPLQARLRDSEAINAAARGYTGWAKAAEAFNEAAREHKAAEDRVKKAETTRRDGLAAAVWPIEGVALDGADISFRGIPLDQCGTSEQILVCGAISAAAIAKKPIRVVRLDGIESMSAKDFDLLSAIYSAHGIQVMASRVSRGDVDAGEITIIDGEVAN